MVLCSVDDYIPVGTALHPTRSESSDFTSIASFRCQQSGGANKGLQISLPQTADSGCTYPKGAQQWRTTSSSTWRHGVARLYTVILPPSYGRSLCMANLSHLTVTILPPFSLAFQLFISDDVTILNCRSSQTKMARTPIFSNIRLLQQ